VAKMLMLGPPIVVRLPLQLVHLDVAGARTSTARACERNRVAPPKMASLSCAAV
jgi:hypothetical protein